MSVKQEMAQMKNDVDTQKGTIQGLNQSVQMQMRMRDEPRAPVSQQVKEYLSPHVMNLY